MRSLPSRTPAFTTYLSKTERARYSFARALEAADTHRRKSCLERELSDAFCRDTGTVASGLIIPPEILFGDDPSRVRTMSAGVPAQGGYLVGAETGALIDFMFPQSVVFKLGARFLGGLVSNVGFPRITASDEAEWLAEGQSAGANHNSQMGQIAQVPHRVYAERTISRQLLAQGAFADALLSILVMGAYAAAIDRAVLVGTGGPQPIGLLNDENVAAVSSGSNGGAPTLPILNSVEGVAIGNKVPLNAPGWVVSTNARTKLKGTQKATGTSTFLLESSDAGDRVNGFSGFATAFLPDTLTKGSGSSLGSAIFGADWSTVGVTQWGALDVMTDSVALAADGKTVIFANALLDVLKQRPEAFAKINDMVTA